MTTTQYTRIKERLDQSDLKTTDEEFQNLVAYAYQKAVAAGKDESYLPYLLPDVIKEYFFRRYINGIPARMAGVEI